MTIYRLALTDSNVKRELKEIRRYVTERKRYTRLFRCQLVEEKENYIRGYVRAMINYDILADENGKFPSLNEINELTNSVISVCSMARRTIENQR